MQASGEHGSFVRELLAKLRLVASVAKIGVVAAHWDSMCHLDACVRTAEAQLHGSAAISVELSPTCYVDERKAARERLLHLLRHLPHLKRLSISACRDLSVQEAAALSDTLQHLDLQVRFCAHLAAVYIGVCACQHLVAQRFMLCLRLRVLS